MIIVESNFSGGFVPPVFANLPIEIIATMAPEQNQPPEVTVLTACNVARRGDGFPRVLTASISTGCCAICSSTERRRRKRLLARRCSSPSCAWPAMPGASIPKWPFWNWLTCFPPMRGGRTAETKSLSKSACPLFPAQRPATADLPGDEAGSRIEKSLQDELAGLPVDERALLERKYFNGETVRALADEWQITEKAMESHPQYPP